MALNREWHLAHPMPPRATFEERAAWHLEHQRECDCRGIPRRLAEQFRERDMLPDGARVDGSTDK